TPGVKGNSGPSGMRGPDGQKGILFPDSIKYAPITPSDFYIELTKPAITSVAAPSTSGGLNAAFVGDTVSVNGLRFAGGDQVFIEGYSGNIDVPCPTTFISSTLLSFVVPNVTGGYAMLEVVQTDGTRSTSKGTLLIRPRIEFILPTSRLKPGQFYFLRGNGLGRSGNIQMNGEGIGSFTSVDNNTIKFKARRPGSAPYSPEGEKVKLKVVNSEGAGAGNPQHYPELEVVLDTYRLLVFGDSVMWGGGLPDHQKYYSLAADYLTSKMENVSVIKTIKAHHGAKIGKGDNIVKAEMNGEMSSRHPTILQQVKSLSSMPDAAEVDLILIDGGANDLPIVDVMLTSDSNKLEAEKVKLRTDTRTFCHDHMKEMLLIALGQFPTAKVIVTGYFHIVSEASDIGFLLKMLLAFKEDIIGFPLWGNTMEATRKKVVALSNVWVEESNKNLAEAVTSINNSLPGDPRIFFVNPETLPVNAAHAANSFLWEPDSVGGPTDPMWKGGREAEREANKARLKSEGNPPLDSNYFITKRNSSYHPNPAGAQRYFDKMKPVLDGFVKSVRVALRANNGLYVCAEGGGNSTLTANRVAIGAWEVFEMIDLGNSRVALKSVDGFYVSADNAGGSSVNVTRLRLNTWETFILESHSTGMAFKTLNGYYLTIASGTGIVSATPLQVSANESFQIL
ncbi:MAG: SGNH/GDSL hydrolase family protein, partial [Bacteroidota bacterium]